VKRVVVMAALLALAACGNPPDQAPRPLPPVVNEPAPVAANGGAYVVKQGDTIYSIARELHISVRSLIDANQLQAPFLVSPGQRLTVPGSGFYVVVKGDNLSMIAKRTGAPFATLARMNGLVSPYILQPGQKLMLPVAAAAPTAVAAAPVPSAPAGRPAPVQVAPPPMSSTASAPPMPLQPSPPTVIAASPLAAPPGAAPPAAPPASTATAPVPPASPVPPAAAAAAPVSAPISTPTQTASLPPAALPEPPAKSGHGFIWPLKGEVILEYGTTGHGQHNDGINIAAPRGTPVIAAESGVVAYAGNELRGFGNLLLIKHEGGWMTAYAHNDVLLVKRGDVVKRGQKIAKVGDSGGVSQPQLHFEVRQGTRAVDPATVLGSGSIPANAPLDPSEPG